jgi:spore maturation protein CgeB
MRTFEVTGAGGVLLTDRKRVLEELFTVDRDLMTYGCFEELKDKTNFLLGNARARVDLRRNGRETAVRRHTFAHRGRAICDVLAHACE